MLFYPFNLLEISELTMTARLEAVKAKLSDKGYMSNAIKCIAHGLEDGTIKLGEQDIPYAERTIKQCTRCGEMKVIKDFYSYINNDRKKSKKYSSRCKSCVKALAVLGKTKKG